MSVAVAFDIQILKGVEAVKTKYTHFLEEQDAEVSLAALTRSCDVAIVF